MHAMNIIYIILGLAESSNIDLSGKRLVFSFWLGHLQDLVKPYLWISVVALGFNFKAA